MSLSDYLAQNYLNADKSSKKRKRKDKSAEEAGFIIADDDNSAWVSTETRETFEDSPIVVSVDGARESVRSKKVTWKAVGVAAPTNADQRAADAIIASAERERRDRAKADDEAPQMINDSGDTQESKVLTSKKEAETVYRDASGRVINLAKKQAEAQRRVEEEARKKKEDEEAKRGDVQRQQKEAKKQQLEDARLMNFSRYADDVELNQELKDRERWSDPALAFLRPNREKKSATGKPLYQGSAPPNRYGIRPGHRWDGVDRSNGYENERFEALNRKRDMKDMEYAWQMDE